MTSYQILKQGPGCCLYLILNQLIHWDRAKSAFDLRATAIKLIFFFENHLNFVQLKLKHWNLVPNGPIENKPALAQIGLGA